MDWLNLENAEILTFIVGIIVGGVFAFGFVVLAMPAVLAIVGTAIGGAAAIMGGLVLLLGRAPVSSLNGGTIGAAIADTEWPWLWILIGIGLAIAGAVAQVRMVGTTADAITKDRYMNPGMSS